MSYLKKLLIANHSYNIGGSNTSLLTLLEFIDHNVYDVDILMLNPKGSLYDKFENYSLIKGSFWLSAISSNLSLEKNPLYFFLYAFIKLIKVFLLILKIDLEYFIYKMETIRLSKNNYDTVITYMEGRPTFFVSHFKNVNKIAWVHCDYSRYLNLIGNKSEEIIYKSFSTIVCVSEYTKSVYCKIYPKLESKVIAIPNIINEKKIIKDAMQMSNLDARFVRSDFNLISVGRISPEKRFSEIPRIAADLRDKGFNFKWFVVGGKRINSEYKKFINSISHHSVEDVVIWLGEKKNPYPYIAMCDLYVSLSVSEACPYVINEAQILNIPVQSTNFGSAKEFIHEKNGIVCQFEYISIVSEELMKNKALYNKLKSNVQKFKYRNDKIISNIYSII